MSLQYIYGDNTNIHHRSVQPGEKCLQFDVNRWVLLSDGEDLIPRLQQPFTFSCAYIIDNAYSCTPGMGSHYLAVQHNGSYWEGVIGDAPTFWACFNCGWFSYGGQITTGLRKDSYGRLFRNIKNIDTMSFDNRMIHTGFISTIRSRRVFAASNHNEPGVNIHNERRIGIGAFPARANGASVRTVDSFIGKVRSIEWLLNRDLNPEEHRAVFNYGSIYAAYQAGKINIPDLRDLISIDMNGPANPSGVPIPFCRPGTRRITVTPYTGSTPNPTGEGLVYHDWDSL